MSISVSADRFLASPALSLTVSVTTDLNSVRQDWLALEASGLASPYQRFDFVAAWVAHVAGHVGVEPLIGLVRDPAGSVVAILPFGVRTVSMLRIGVYLGGAHVNFAMPLIALSALADLTPDAATRLLSDYCAAGRIDALHLENQPAVWRGRRHPFVDCGTCQPSPSQGFVASFAGTFEAFLGGRLSKDRASKFARKQRKLAEAGTAFVGADPIDAPAVDLLDAFLQQKAIQFSRMAVTDPFAEPGVVDFLRAALRPVDGRAPALMLRCLREASGAPLALAGGIRNGPDFSLLVMSYDADHDFAKQSPGEVLLARLMDEVLADGVDSFDFGVGEALYKTVWSTAAVPLFDLSLAATAAGRFASFAARSRRNLLGYIKRRPRLLKLARRASYALKGPALPATKGRQRP